MEALGPTLAWLGYTILVTTDFSQARNMPCCMQPFWLGQYEERTI